MLAKGVAMDLLWIGVVALLFLLSLGLVALCDRGEGQS
jgi:hypothetical protein